MKTKINFISKIQNIKSQNLKMYITSQTKRFNNIYKFVCNLKIENKNISNSIKSLNEITQIIGSIQNFYEILITENSIKSNTLNQYKKIINKDYLIEKPHSTIQIDEIIHFLKIYNLTKDFLNYNKFSFLIKYFQNPIYKNSNIEKNEILFSLIDNVQINTSEKNLISSFILVNKIEILFNAIEKESKNTFEIVFSEYLNFILNNLTKISKQQLINIFNNHNKIYRFFESIVFEIFINNITLESQPNTIYKLIMNKMNKYKKSIQDSKIYNQNITLLKIFYYFITIILPAIIQFKLNMMNKRKIENLEFTIEKHNIFHLNKDYLIIKKYIHENILIDQDFHNIEEIIISNYNSNHNINENLQNKDFFEFMIIEYIFDIFKQNFYLQINNLNYLFSFLKYQILIYLNFSKIVNDVYYKLNDKKIEKKDLFNFNFNFIYRLENHDDIINITIPFNIIDPIQLRIKFLIGRIDKFIDDFKLNEDKLKIHSILKEFEFDDLLIFYILSKIISTEKHCYKQQNELNSKLFLNFLFLKDVYEEGNNLNMNNMLQVIKILIDISLIIQKNIRELFPENELNIFLLFFNKYSNQCLKTEFIDEICNILNKIHHYYNFKKDKPFIIFIKILTLDIYSLLNQNNLQQIQIIKSLLKLLIIINDKIGYNDKDLIIFLDYMLKLNLLFKKLEY